MSQRALDAVFRPAAIALAGASPRPRSLGRWVLGQLREGGFPGPLGVVNPHYAEIDGLAAVKAFSALGFAPELTIIAVPPAEVAATAREAAENGARAVIVLTRNLTDAQRADLLAVARAHGLRVIGPNCLGVIAPHARVSASFAAHAPPAGDLALVSHSGAVAAGLLEWARPRQIGFSAVVSVGEALDVDFADLLDYFAADPKTRAILLYLERIPDARRFLSAARAAARAKPVVVVKPGRHARRTTPALTHASALARPDAVYDAAFARAGMLRVHALDELFAAAETLAHLRPLPGERLAVMTNGIGLGMLALDRLRDLGGTPATLSPATIATLDAALPHGWSRRNAIDMLGDADGARYALTLNALLDDPECDAVLALHAPTALSTPEATAAAVQRAVLARQRSGAAKPVLAAWIGSDPKALALLHQAGIPTYTNEAAAVRGFTWLTCWQAAQTALMKTPPSLPDDFNIDLGAAHTVVETALAQGEGWLTRAGCVQLLDAYGIATAPPSPAAKGSQKQPQNQKPLSPTPLPQAGEGLKQQTSLIPTSGAASGALELLAGLTDDPVFGPVVVFGRGGAEAGLIDDIALALPPLDLRLARAQIERTRIARRLAPDDRAALALLLVKLAQLAADFPAIAELELNPVLPGHGHAQVLDARIRVAAPTLLHKGRGHPRFAIFPYPKEWERRLTLASGRDIFVRPLRPEDDALLRAFFAKVSHEDLRLRFFSAVREFSHAFIARMVQLDYARAIALAAIDPASGEMLGAVRLLADADYHTGEYAIMVRSDLKGAGLGWALMQIMLEYARWQGLTRIEGQVLRENTTMLSMCRELGFSIMPEPDDASIAMVRLVLKAPLPFMGEGLG